MRKLLVAALMIGVIVFAACGGGDGDDDVQLPPGDEGEIQQLIMDFVKAKVDADQDALVATYSTQCAERVAQANLIISRWSRFREDVGLKVIGFDFDQLEADFATGTPKAQLIIEGLEPSDASTLPVQVVKEDGAWKISTCGYNLPASAIPVDFQ